MVGVELAQLAGVKHLVLYHHEPMFDDRTIETILGETRRYEELSRIAQQADGQLGLRRARDCPLRTRRGRAGA